MLWIIVDATATAAGMLVNYMSRYGVIQELVSDNGPQFTSVEFKECLQGNGIKHTRSAPYHPATNGQAERFVKAVKQGLQLCMRENPNDSVQLSLDRFLMAYRTGESPAHRFLGRGLTT